jgi:hypothetical protein
MLGIKKRLLWDKNFAVKNYKILLILLKNIFFPKKIKKRELFKIFFKTLDNFSQNSIFI